MLLKNLILTNKYAESVEESYSVAHDSFENALYKVEYFYPTMHISREQVCHDQIMENEKLVSLRY